MSRFVALAASGDGIFDMRFFNLTALAASALALGACTSSSSTTENGLQANVSEKAIVADKPLTTGVPEVGRINKKGGTKIAILVNKTPITTNDIRRRAAFLKLRRVKGNSTELARKELVEEALKMQEARRIKTVASDKDVDAAYSGFAKRNKMPVNVLTRILTQRGVTKQGFKQYIRAQMSWQRAVGARLRAEQRGVSTTAKRVNFQRWLPDAENQGKQEREYTLQQVVFTVPVRRRDSLLGPREREAKAFRTRLNGCENARTLAKGLKDVAVKDLGRVREHRLPPRWREELLPMQPGSVTRTKRTEKGVEIIAVCKQRTIQSTAPVNTAIFANDGEVQKAASDLDKKYVDELRERAVIKYR